MIYLMFSILLYLKSKVNILSLSIGLVTLQCSPFNNVIVIEFHKAASSSVQFIVALFLHCICILPRITYVYLYNFSVSSWVLPLTIVNTLMENVLFLISVRIFVFVIWPIFVILLYLRRHLISMPCILRCIYLFNVHVIYSYNNIDEFRDRNRWHFWRYT